MTVLEVLLLRTGNPKYRITPILKRYSIQFQLMNQRTLLVLSTKIDGRKSRDTKVKMPHSQKKCFLYKNFNKKIFVCVQTISQHFVKRVDPMIKI
jgi:hypothetical protein